jgi:hypothetical protein
MESWAARELGWAFDVPRFTEVRPAIEPVPPVSVVIPTFKVRGMLLEAVQSTLAQTWSDLEIIVVDDADPDRSIDDLADVADQRLRIVQLERNVGQGGARNVGIALARGEFIALLDADDRSKLNRIASQVAYLEAHPKVGLVAGLADRFDDHGRLISKGRDVFGLADDALAPLLLFTNPLTTSSFMVRRGAIPRHGFRSILAEDYGFLWDVVATGNAIGQIARPLVEYRINSAGTMATRFERVAQGALSVHSEVMGRLGLPTGSYDVTLAREVMFYGSTPATVMSVEWFGRVFDYFEMVRRANSVSKIFDAHALERASQRFWDLLLIESSRRGGLRAESTALSLVLRPDPQSKVSLRLRALTHLIANAIRPQRPSRQLVG